MNESDVGGEGVDNDTVILNEADKRQFSKATDDGPGEVEGSDY
jgi:hypothetical protein